MSNVTEVVIAIVKQSNTTSLPFCSILLYPVLFHDISFVSISEIHDSAEESRHPG